MVRRAAAIAALLGTLTACSLQHPKAAPSPAAPPIVPDAVTTESPATSEPSAEPYDRVGARAELRRALRAFRRTGTGDFTAELALPDDSFEVHRRGSYALRGLRSEYQAYVGTPSGGVGMDVRSSGEAAWYAMTRVPGTEQPERDCWIHIDPQVVEDVTDVEIPSGPGYGFPAEIVALTWARAKGYDSNGMVAGTTNLYAAASVGGSNLPMALGIRAGSKARVPATFVVSDGVLLGWYVEFTELVQAADDAGHLPRGVRRQLATDAESLDTRLHVEFESLQEDWRFRPPPPRKTIEMAADESFDTAMRNCTGLDQGGA